MDTGITPFWFWNGNMENDEIIRQIRECHEKGVGGFFIHPRQGLTVPYLSEQWFEKVKLAVEEAKRNHLDVWIYDEYPYPSGISGGEVILEHPEYEAKQLQSFRIDAEGEKEISADLPWGKVVFAKAYPIENGIVNWNKPVGLEEYIGISRSDQIFQYSGLTAYSRKRFFEGNLIKRLHCNLKAGKYRIFIFVETVMKHMKFYDHFVDPLMPGAVKCFLQTTHEQYKKHLGNEFGKTIRGFFSDEIALPPQGGAIHWSPCLPELFEQRYHYSLLDWLPALLEPMGEGTDRFRYDYKNLTVDRFIQCYDKQIQQWCHQNNLLYVAEKPILRTGQLQYLDIPGCDTGHQKVYSAPAIMKSRYRANPKMVSSAAHFYGKRRALCECFHSIGWGMTMQDMKWIIDLLAIHGINMVVPHAFFYTTDGLAKHDAPPSSFFQQPYWKDMGRLTAHVRNLCKTLTDGNRKVDILLLDPVGSQWTAVAEKRQLGQKLADDFLHLQQTLLKNHLDYYIIDPGILGQFEVRDGCLRRSGEDFRLLVLPPMTNMEDETAQRIADFMEKGARVISTGCVPVEQIGKRDVSALFGKLFNVDPAEVFEEYLHPESAGKRRASGRFVPNIDEIPGLLSKDSLRDFSVLTQGRENPDILGVHYCKQDREYYFFANTSGRPCSTQIVFGPKNTYPIEQVSLQDETMRPVETDGTLSRTVTAEFAPLESKLYCVDKTRPVPAGKISSAVKPAPRQLRFDAANSIWDLAISGSNALRLGHFEMAVEAVGGKPLSSPIACGEVSCEPVVNQAADSGVRLPVETREYFGCPKELILPALKCRYSAEFCCGGGIGPVFLVMEPGTIGGKWQLAVNGHFIEPGQFGRREFYLPTNRAVEITPWITRGRNEIVLTVNTQKDSDGLRNPLYLFGNFGVFKDRDSGLWKLAGLPSKGTISDMAGCGLPFYAGERILSGKFELSQPQDIQIRFENYKDDDSITLTINGRPAGTCSWEPYGFPIESGLAKAGENQIELHIRSTLLGLFEGQKFDQDSHRCVDFT